MTYRGHELKMMPQQLKNLGERRSMAVVKGGTVLAYVADAEFGRHVIDVKIAEGVWHDGSVDRPGDA